MMSGYSKVLEEVYSIGSSHVPAVDELKQSIFEQAAHDEATEGHSTKSVISRPDVKAQFSLSSQDWHHYANAYLPQFQLS